MSRLAGGDPAVTAELATSLHEEIARICADRAQNPGVDLISRLVREHEAGGLSADELTSTVHGLLLAGHDGTANLIGNAFYLLLTHPSELAGLVASPDLLPQAVEEFARYSTPWTS